MQPGEIYWAAVPFRTGGGSKERSFLLLHTDAGSGFGIEGTGQDRSDLTLLFVIDRARPEFANIRVPTGRYYCEGARELPVAVIAGGELRGRLTDKQVREILRKLNAWLIRRNPPPGMAH